jgi:predicted nuclease with TOPRIM domain
MDEDLREQVASLRERVSVLEVTTKRTEEEVENISGKLDTLLSKLDRYEGKLGGVLIAAAAFFALFKFVASTGWEFFKSLGG